MELTLQRLKNREAPALFFLGNIEDICYGNCKKVKSKDNMNHEIKVLFLDIDNTLLDFDAGAAWGMEQ